MKRLKKFGPRYGMKQFAEGGDTASKTKLHKPISMGKLLLGGALGALPVAARYFSNPSLNPNKYLLDLEEQREKEEEEKLGKMRKGGKVKSSASKRADGCAVKGKTKGRFV